LPLLPKDIMNALIAYAKTTPIQGLNYGSLIEKLCGKEADDNFYELVCQMIGNNHAAIPALPYITDLDDDDDLLVCSNETFIALVEYTRDNDPNMDLYEIRNGRIYDTYDEMYIDEEYKSEEA